MIGFLAQVAPVTSGALVGAPGLALDWGHLVLGLVALVLPVIVAALAHAKWGRAAKLVGFMLEASAKHDHGEPWAQAVLETAEAHSGELADLAMSVLPPGLAEPEPDPPAPRRVG